MTTLCKVLHYNTTDLSPNKDITKLRSFVALADKFDCTPASMFYGRSWLSMFWENPSDLADLLSIAYYFDDPHTFKKVSVKLLKESKGVRNLRALQKAASRFPIDIRGEFVSIYLTKCGNIISKPSR
jgi:hypothetical protein